MRNKGIVVILTIIISLLCLYYLSFTFVALRVQDDATDFATNKDGALSLERRQIYLDSLWNQPVYSLFGIQYTYKDVKENELSLGLDLQGGMHVVIEVSPVEIVRGLSGNNQDAAFTKALDAARIKQKTSQGNFADMFYAEFKKVNPDRTLASVFVSAANKGRVSLSDTDNTVLKFLKDEIESAIDRSFTILKTRIDQFGTSAPNIQKLQGSGRIQIEIPGADNPQRVRKLLQGVARLEFWEVVEYNDPQLSAALGGVNQMLLKEQNAKRRIIMDTTKAAQKLALGDTSKSALEEQLKKASQDTTGNSLDSLARLSMSPLFALSNQGIPFLYNLKDTATINAILKREDVRAIMPRTTRWFWDVKGEPELTKGIEDLRLNFVNVGRSGKPLLTGEVINDARLEYDQFARPAVSMTMNATGAKTWGKVTAAAAAKTPQGRIAIVLDNFVYTAPTVNGEIPNGNSQISGSFTLEEAKDLALVLKAGSLPAPTRIVEEAIIGPTLGKVAAQQGINSMAVGLALIVIFMIVYYSTAGWVANFALIFNNFFILGILAQFNAALTLPGIAGIVLTMGMAVDANVLIYERIKEELRAGRKLRDAISRGYDKAFGSIFDSHVTTFISGLFLFIFGQGPLRGFATVLMIGIVTSLFTSVFISHVVVEFLVRKGDDVKISFETRFARLFNGEATFHFMNFRKLAYIFSNVFVLIGFVLIFINGLNLGVDFKGGRTYVVTFHNPVESTDVRNALVESFEKAGTEVKNYGGNNVMKVTTSYLIDDVSDAADDKVKVALIAGVKNYTKLDFSEDDRKVDAQHFTISASSKVGPTIADDIKGSALQAGLFSLIGIFLYILLRFRKWQFSTGAVIALIHDSMFVFAAFGIADAFGIKFEIDQIFVAALLTVVGFSINDTVIIFDRIREYLGMGTNHDTISIFNTAINNTLHRTIITSGTVLVVVLVLLIFGGEVLRGFSFALLVGMAIGTYSSIFIAAPVVIDLDKKTRTSAEGLKA